MEWLVVFALGCMIHTHGYDQIKAGGGFKVFNHHSSGKYRPCVAIAGGKAGGVGGWGVLTCLASLIFHGSHIIRQRRECNLLRSQMVKL